MCVVDGHRIAITEEFPARVLQNSRGAVDKGALARAIFAYQGMYLPAPEIEVHLAQSVGGAESFADAAQLQTHGLVVCWAGEWWRIEGGKMKTAGPGSGKRLRLSKKRKSPSIRDAIRQAAIVRGNEVWVI